MYKLVDYLKSLLIIPVTLLLSGVSMISKNVDNSVSELFKYSLVGSVTSGDNIQFIFVIENLSFLIMFVILYGNIIHRHFSNAADYIFIRIGNRWLWYVRECVHLLIVAMFYSVIYLLVKFSIAINISSYKCDVQAIKYFFLFLGWTCCLNLIFTLIINMIALIWDTNFSMIIFSIGVVALVSLAIATSTNNVISFLNPLNINMQLFPKAKLVYLLGATIIIGGMFGGYISKYDIGVKEVK